jgi:hypothetical protein
MDNFMTQKSQDYPPNGRRMLNEIMMLLFTPEAAIENRISTERVGALVAQFESAAKSDVSIVKSLLSKLVGQLEIVENRIELREIGESQRAFNAMLEAEDKRRHAREAIRAARLRHEGQEHLRRWLVTDQEVVLQRIKSKELLTLPEFLKARGGSKRTVSSAVAADRLFCITGPDGRDYYPAFFADANEYNRQCLGKVCQALRSVSAYAKYQFLTTNSSWTGEEAPIDAIRSGRVNNVLHIIKWLLQSD